MSNILPSLPRQVWAAVAVAWENKNMAKQPAPTQDYPQLLAYSVLYKILESSKEPLKIFFNI